MLWAVLVGAAGVGNHELWTADEPRVAEVGRAMWADGFPAVPRLAGEPFLEKPPLYFWAEGAMFSAFGRATAELARSVSALFSFASLLLAAWLARRWLSRRETILGVLLLLTSWMFVQRSHWIIVDTALLFGTTGALAAFAASLDARGARRAGALALLYGFFAAAFFAKGTVGIAIPALGILVYLLWSGRFRRWVGWHLPVGIVVVLGLAGLWLLAVDREAGAAGVGTFLAKNQLGRLVPWATGYSGGHQNPPWYYLLTLPVDFLPATPLLVLALVSFRRRWGSLSEEKKDAVRFLLATSVPAFLALSIAGTKRGLYLLPILPSLALLTGLWLASGPREGGRAATVELWWGRLVAALGPLLAVGAWAAVFFHPPVWPLALAGTLAFALLAGPRLRALRRAEGADAWALRLTLLAAGFAVVLIVALPALDTVKSFTPFTDRVREEVPPGRALLAVAPDETTLGVLGFYTDREIRIAPRLADVPAAVETSGTPVVLLTWAKDGERDLDRLRSRGLPLEPVEPEDRHRIGDRRVMWLLFADPPGPGR